MRGLGGSLLHFHITVVLLEEGVRLQGEAQRSMQQPCIKRSILRGKGALPRRLFDGGGILAFGDDLEEVHGFAAQLLDALPKLQGHLRAASREPCPEAL